MKSNLNRPIWPYMLVLCGLFAITMRVPRTWERVANSDAIVPRANDPAQSDSVARRPVQLPAAVDARIPTITIATLHSAADDLATDRAIQPETQQTLAADLPLSDGSDTSETETSALPTLPEFPAPAPPALAIVGPLTAPGDLPGGPFIAEVRKPREPVAGGVLLILTEPEPEESLAFSGPALVQPEQDNVQPQPAKQLRPSTTAATKSIATESIATGTAPAERAANWPEPANLLSMLDSLADQDPSQAWATKTKQIISQLLTTAELPAERQANTDRLSELRRLAKQVQPFASEAGNESLRTELLRTQFALRRRLPFWEAVLANLSAEDEGHGEGIISDAALIKHVVLVKKATGDSEVGRAWREFLLVDKLHNVLLGVAEASPAERRVLREKILERLARARVDQSSSEFARQDFLAAFDTALRRWSPEPIASSRVLWAIESYEQGQGKKGVKQIFELHRSLALSSNRQDLRMAEAIGRIYRNANVRLTFTSELVNRWLPRDEVVAEPVRDRVLGARVVGRSRTQTDVQLRFLPSSDSLRMAIEARGKVYSSTAAESGPAIFYNAGRASFVAEKELVVDANGIRTLPARSLAQHISNLISVGTNYDSIPLIGSVARSIAKSQHDDSKPDANTITERKIAARARAQLNEQADEKVRQLEQEVRARFFSPLEHLQLKPTPMELATTDERAVMRLRFANGYQLAAHTPRPQAPADSLASLQVHESALNNALDGLQLEGRTFELGELHAYLARKIGREPQLPEDLPSDVRMTFDTEQAVSVRCVGGNLRVTLQLSELSTSRDTFRGLEVVASYNPQVSGMHTELVRNQSIRLQGKGLSMRDQIVLRGVFSKVFSRNRPLQIIDSAKARDPRLSQMRVTELVLEDGWIGLSIGPAVRVQPNIARQPLPLRRSN